MNNRTVKGATERDGRLHCDKCNADIANSGAKFIAHADGIDTYRNIYNCGVCGHVITVINQRKKCNAGCWNGEP